MLYSVVETVRKDKTFFGRIHCLEGSSEYFDNPDAMDARVEDLRAAGHGVKWDLGATILPPLLVRPRKS